MAKKKNTSGKIKIIKQDAVLSINMSTGFYLRCKAVASFLIDGKSNEEIAATYEKMRNQKIDQAWESHLETILILCAEFDKQAAETGNIEEITKEELEEKLTAAKSELDPSESEDQK